MEVFDNVTELLVWVDATLDVINGSDANTYATDRWTFAAEQLVASAYRLGLPEIVAGHRDPLPNFMYAPDSQEATTIRDELRRRLVFARDTLTGKKPARKGSKSKKPTANERMKAELAVNMETVKGWSAQQWADHLQCAKSTIAETETWKDLSLRRQQLKAEHQRDRRRR